MRCVNIPLFVFLFSLLVIPTVALPEASSSNSSAGAEYESEVKLVQELKDAVGQLNGDIAEQKKMLSESTTDRERKMIQAQITTLGKHKATLERLTGELTGELTFKGVPVEELLAEQKREKRDRLDQERERIIVERREVEQAERV